MTRIAFAEGVETVDFQDEMLVVGAGGWVALGALDAALVRFLDEDTTVAELIDDLHFTGLPKSVAEQHVSDLISRFMEARIMVSAEAVQDSGHLLDSHEAIPEASEAEEDIGQPRIVVTGPEVEVLPDGTERVTTKIEYTTSSARPFEIEDDFVLDDQSPAELAPPDSCTGRRLRLDQDGFFVTLWDAHGHPRSIRSTERRYLELIEHEVRDSGLRVTIGRSGPTEVFVVAPLEGCGPVRIYDRWARRRGRPRSDVELVGVIDQLFGDAVSAVDQRLGVVQRLALVLAVSPDGQTWLLPSDLGLDRHLPSRARRLGWEIASATAILRPDGSVGTPLCFSSPDWYHAGEIWCAIGVSDGSSGLSRVRDFLGDRRLVSTNGWGLLDGLYRFCQSVRLVDRAEVRRFLGLE